MLESFIHVTRECNNNCIFCGFPKRNLFLDFEKVKEKLVAAKKNKTRLITLTGGEPFMHPDIIRIVVFIHEQGMESRITTNGTHLDEEFLGSLKRSGLNYLAVSLHSFDEKNSKIIAGNPDYDVSFVRSFVKSALKIGFPVYLNTTILRLNYKELPCIAQKISDNFPEIHLVNFNYVNLHGNASKEEYTRKVPVKISDVELYLYSAMNILSKSKINFRVERVPLCYMIGFEKYSSEYNRVMEIERPSVDMIDGHYVASSDFFKEYKKSDLCKFCSKNKICLGLHNNYANKFGLKELFPIFD